MTWNAWQESGRNTSCRTHDPIPTIALIELRSLAGAVLSAVAVEHDYRLADGLGTLCIHLTDGKHGCKLRAGVGPAVDEIAFAILVPEWGSIDISLAADNAYGLFPFACGVTILSLYHHHSEVGVAPVDIILACMISDAGSPDTIAVLRLTAEMLKELAVALVEVFQGVAYNLPVYEVFRVKDG